MNNKTYARAFLLSMLLITSAAVWTACGASSEPKDVTFALNITESKLDLDPPVIKAKQGDTVTLNIRSDKDGKFHLHGYDLDVTVKSEQPAQLYFAADATGKFDFEFHGGSEAEHSHEDGDQDHEGESCQAQLPADAPAPKLQVQAGAASEPGHIRVAVAIENFLLQSEPAEGNLAGGHWHLFINDELKGMYTSPEKTVPVPTAGEYDVMVTLTDAAHCAYGVDFMTKVTVAEGHSEAQATQPASDEHEDGEEPVLLGSLEVHPR